jgi:hypothetical protein
MVAHLPVPGVMRITFAGLFSSGSDWSTALDFAWSRTGGGAPTGGEVNGVAQDSYEAWTANMSGNLPSDSSIEQCTATPLDSEAYPVGVWTQSTAGTIPDFTTPAGLCVVVSKTVVNRWRGGRPKNYFPGAPASWLQDPSNWHTDNLATYMTGVKNMMDAMSSIETGSLALGTPVAISYVETVIDPGPPPTATHGVVRVPPLVMVVTDLNGRQRVGSQRRRISSTTP